MVTIRIGQRILLSSLLFMVGTLVLPSCDDPITDPSDCSPSITPQTATVDMQVEYSVTTSGDATVNSITYRDENGTEQTVSSPELPWEHSIEVQAGDTVSLNAAGGALNGGVQISIRGEDNAGGTYSYEDSCSHSAD